MACRQVLRGLLRNAEKASSLGASSHFDFGHLCRQGFTRVDPANNHHGIRFCSSSTICHPVSDTRAASHALALSNEEARAFLKHIKVDDFKKHLLSHNGGTDCVPLHDAVKLCKQTGTAVTDAEAEELIKKLDEAGVVLIFRKRVFLEPQKVAELLSRAIPLPLAHEDDPRKQELAQLEKEKAEIDRIAQKQVRNMLWGALGAFAAQSALFFRLTFWDLSWDVMEPITFFVTSSSLLVGFFFFVITNRDPSYQDFMRTLLASKQKKLMKKKNFNLERLKELQMQCGLPPHYGAHVSQSFRVQ